MAMKLRKVEKLVGDPDLPCTKGEMLRYLNRYGYLLPRDSAYKSPWDAETMAVLALGPGKTGPSGSIVVTVGFTPDETFETPKSPGTREWLNKALPGGG